MKIPLRYIFGACLLLISCGGMIWSAWPTTVQKRELNYPAGQLLPEGADEGADQLAPLMEPRRLLITWPRRVWSGDIQPIRLVFETVPASLPISEGSQAFSGKQSGQASSLESYKVFVDARLELSEVAFTPKGQASQKLLLGEPVHFVWHMQPVRAQAYHGTLWVYLRLVPQDGAAETRLVLTAQVVEFNVVRLLGLDLISIRLLSSLGIAIGVVLTLDQAAIRIWRALQRWLNPAP